MERPPGADLLELIGEFYDCAIDPARWPAALGRLALLVAGSHATIWMESAKREPSLISGGNVDPGFVRAMLASFAINPLASAHWYFDVDQPYTAVGFLGGNELKNTRWHRQTIAPYRYGDILMTLLAKSGNQFGSLSVLRHEDQDAFAQDDLDRLRVVAPHVRRAAMIADMLDARALQRDTLATTLELLTVGIILTDATARIAYANHAGQALLDDGSALRRDGDHLSARDLRCAGSLRQAIIGAATGSTIDVPKLGIAVPIAGIDKRDLAAWVLLLDRGLRRDLGATFTARVAIFVRELGDASPFPAELFVRRFRVTPAECQVLMLLTQGMTTKNAAEALGTSPTTVKTHIGHLFEKTGTQRQADLVRLAMSAFAPASR
jgi:DNA-binding CsgD family transcriptional regulator/PAS domain-containing protein